VIRSDDIGRGPLNLKYSAIFASVALFWGLNWLVVKIGLSSAPPFWLATARFVVAFIFLGIVVLVTRTSYAEVQKNFWKVMYSGIFSYALSYCFVYWGQSHVSSGMAALLFASITFFVAIFSVFMLPDERMTLFKALGVIVGFGGLVVVYYADLRVNTVKSVLGATSIVLGAASAGYATVYVKKHLRHINAIALSHAQMLSGFILLLVLSIALEDPRSIEFDAGMILPTLYNSIFGTALAFWGFFYLLSRMDTVKLSMVGFVTPIVAILAGWIVLSEDVTVRFFLGAVMVIIGIVLATLDPSAARTRSRH